MYAAAVEGHLSTKPDPRPRAMQSCVTPPPSGKDAANGLIVVRKFAHTSGRGGVTADPRCAGVKSLPKRPARMAERPASVKL